MTQDTRFSSPSQPAVYSSSYQDLLHEFSNVVYSDGLPASKLRQDVRHHIITNYGPPVFAKPCRLNPEKLAFAKAEISAMKKEGIIHCSNSPWSSPLHIVKKKDGGWPPCGDYRLSFSTWLKEDY